MSRSRQSHYMKSTKAFEQQQQQIKKKKTQQPKRQEPKRQKLKTQRPKRQKLKTQRSKTQRSETQRSKTLKKTQKRRDSSIQRQKEESLKRKEKENILSEMLFDFNNYLNNKKKSSEINKLKEELKTELTNINGNISFEMLKETENFKKIQEKMLEFLNTQEETIKKLFTNKKPFTNKELQRGLEVLNENYKPQINYFKENKVGRGLDDKNTSCSICFETIHKDKKNCEPEDNINCNSVNLPCNGNHKFHSKCILEYFLKSRKIICPLCRFNFDYVEKKKLIDVFKKDENKHREDNLDKLITEFERKLLDPDKYFNKDSDQYSDEYSDDLLEERNTHSGVRTVEGVLLGTILTLLFVAPILGIGIHTLYPVILMAIAG